jgi:hypothetical protein
LTRVILQRYIISIVEPPIRLCIPLPKKLYKRTRRRLRTIDEVEKYFPGFRIFIDYRKGHPKAKEKEERRDNYPDKKKKNTIKILSRHNISMKTTYHRI